MFAPSSNLVRLPTAGVIGVAAAIIIGENWA
jgi:hypothetical protein